MIRFLSPFWFFAPIKGANFTSLFCLGWIPLAVAGIGALASLYGANKQSKDNAAANAANAAAIKEQDLNSWKAYLMQRGLDPSGVMTYGQIPQNARPVNTRLPLWASGNFNAAAPAAGTQRTSMVRRRAA